MESSNKIDFSPIIVGTMRLGDWGAKMTTNELEYFIDGCVDLGLRDFDHADIYGHYTMESQFGAVLRRRPDLKNKLQHTTKCSVNLVSEKRPQYAINYYETTAAHIETSVENSLQNLALECIDLFLIHRPDYLMKPEEVAAKLKDLVDDGKIKHVGVSNYSPSLLDLFHHHFPQLVTNQIEASITHLDPLEDGSLHQCMKLGIRPTAWSPLGAGADLFDPNCKDERILRIRSKAEALGEKYGASPDQMYLGWLMRHPSNMIPVIGTTKLDRVKKALEATKLELEHQDWYDMLAASKGKGVD